MRSRGALSTDKELIMTTTVLRCPPSVSDLTTIKARQQATWASGDYSIIGATLQIVAESLCEAIDLRAGERVLDVEQIQHQQCAQG
jgi:hypothetical protein